MKHSHICMHTNAVVNSVMLQLYLQHDFYKIIFKIQNKSYSSFKVSNPPPKKNSWCAPANG